MFASIYMMFCIIKRYDVSVQEESVIWSKNVVVIVLCGTALLRATMLIGLLVFSIKGF